MADYLYLVQLDIPEALEGEFNRIYDTQHVPNLLTVPGVRACHRYRLESADVEGVARYAAIYEIDSPGLTNSAAWKRASDLGDWATKIRPHTTNRSHVIFKRVA